MTADYVAFHASERPDAVAIIDHGREVTYAQLDRDIRAFARAVREFGLSPGNAVAVGLGNAYAHWLLLIAFERLGVTTASYQGGTESGITVLFAGVDLVLSDSMDESGAAKRHQLISEEWLRRVFSAPDGASPEPAPREPGSPIRLLRTSGTTGSSKRVLLTRRMIEAWIDRWIWSLGITRATRYLVTFPFAVTGIYTLATAVIRSGGTVVLDAVTTPRGTISALTAHAITHVVMAPIGLKRILEDLPADFTKPKGLTLCTIGAATAAPLREQALARLASEVVVYYGCNEVPFISETRSSGSEGPGSVFPWVRAEVVDDLGEPSPAGTMGRVRLQADAMARGYLDDPEATAMMFRGDWFYPGDMGILHGPRLLQIVGRVDDLLNIGGQKIPPSGLEALILRHAHVVDVGVCAIPDANGIQEIHVAVSGSRGTDDELLEQVGRAFAGARIAGFYVIKVDQIPRNANGKIERGRLNELIVQAMRQRKPHRP